MDDFEVAQLRALGGDDNGESEEGEDWETERKVRLRGKMAKRRKKKKSAE
jgi:hypothetical protein